MQRLLKKSVRFGLHHCGGLAIVKSLYRSKLRILFYHRFQASDRDWTSEFETQCRHLRKRYSPLSLTQAAIHIRDHKPFPPNAVVVTVDDGYRDFGTVAYPILARYGIPATIYVVANFIENNEWLWWDRIWYCLRHTPYNSFRVRLPAGSDLQLSLQGEAARESAAEVLSEALKSLPNQEMRRMVEDLPREVKVEMPVRKPEYLAALSWPEARTLAANGMEIGSHTLSHPILPRVALESEVQEEIIAAKRLIEDRIQRPVEHFSYPNGDYDERAELAVKQAGYATTTTAHVGLVDPSCDPLKLNRMSMMPLLSGSKFRETLAGLQVAFRG